MFEGNDVVARLGAVGLFQPNVDTSFTDGLKAALEAARDTTHYNPIQDFKNILQDDHAFESYRDIMFADVLGDRPVAESTTYSYLSDNTENNLDLGYMSLHNEKLDQLIENTKQALYEASTVGQLEPIVALTLPLMKKAYIKSAYKDAIPTLTADKMLINIGYERDFLKDRTGKKYYLPDIFYPENEDTYIEVIKGTVGKPISDKFYPELPPATLPFADLNLLEESGGSLATRDVLGYDLMIDQVQMKVPVAKTAEESIDGKTFDASGFKVITVKGLKIKPDFRTRTFTGEVCQPSLIKGDDTVTVDTILGLIDFYSGKVSITCLLGLIQKVHFSGHLSCTKSEFKQHATASIETKKNQ